MGFNSAFKGLIPVEEFAILVNQYLFSTIICSFVLGKTNKIKINSKE